MRFLVLDDLLTLEYGFSFTKDETGEYYQRDEEILRVEIVGVYVYSISQLTIGKIPGFLMMNDAITKENLEKYLNKKPYQSKMPNFDY